MKKKSDNLYIDLDKIVAEKTKKSKIRIPKFIVSLFKKIVHQDEINYHLDQGKDKKGVAFIDLFFKNTNIKYKVHSEVELDKNKQYLFVSNHPLGGLDGMVLISYVGNTMGSVKMAANDFLMNLKPLEECFFPINKLGSMNREYTKILNETFMGDNQILYFPAGLCSRLIKGEITDLTWKKTFIKKALESNRDIVPIYFKGKNSMFFYRLAKFRKWAKIKFNIEMIFLPSEMFKQKNTTFELFIKEPISIEEIRESKQPIQQWVDQIRTKVYETNN